MKKNEMKRLVKTPESLRTNLSRLLVDQQPPPRKAMQLCWFVLSRRNNNKPEFSEVIKSFFSSTELAKYFLWCGYSPINLIDRAKYDFADVDEFRISVLREMINCHEIDAQLRLDKKIARIEKKKNPVVALTQGLFSIPKRKKI